MNVELNVELKTILEKLETNIAKIKDTYLDTNEYPINDVERILVDADILINKIKMLILVDADILINKIKMLTKGVE